MTAVIQLPLLQGLIRRDPVSYREEFQLQKHHYQSQVDLLQLKPTQENDQLVELLEFISHTISCYPEEAQSFIQQLMHILEQSCSILAPPIRLKIFQSIVLVRNKIPSINSLDLLKLSFKLLGMNDKVFRAYVTQFIFNDIKTITITKTNMTVYRAVQSFLHKFISEETSLIAQKSVHIMSELYRKRIWTDAKTINIITSAIYNPNHSVFMAAIHFFLGIDTKMLEDEETEKQNVTKARESINLHEHSKKTRKRQRLVEKQQLKIAKLQKELSERNANGGSIITKPLLPAIMVINNPNELSEFLFKKLKSTNNSTMNFENKLLVMNFLSQLIGCHKLILLSFYSFLQKYITAHQQHITNVLVYLIQSCHEYIPPADLLPIIKNIAFHFVTERSSDENITLGINTIREIFVRNPSILLEEDLKDLVQDLVLYTHKHKKCVVSAARSLVNYVRSEYPTLLHKGDRGKGTDLSKVPLQFGQARVLDSREILNYDDNEAEDEEGSGDNEEKSMDGESDEWEEDEDAEDESDGEEEEWADVDHDGEEGGDVEEDGEEAANEDDDDDVWESMEEDEEVDVDASDDEKMDDSSEEEKKQKGVKSLKKSVSFKDTNEEGSNVLHETKSKRKKSQSIRNRLDVSRVLTGEDLQLFERFKALRDGKLKKRPREEDEDTREEESELEEENDDDEGPSMPDYMVDPSSILPSTSTGKTTKIERMQRILSGRTDKKFEHEGHAGGLTNKEKLRKKNYMMVRKGKREVVQKFRRGSADARKAKATQKEVYGRDRRKKRRI